MPTIAEYEAWKAGKQANEAGKANIVLSQPFPTEPDQFAADTMLAREAGDILGNPVPMSLVQETGTRSVFEQIIAEKKRSTVLTQSPRLSEWLRAPDNAAVARDNLEGLSWWETFAGATGNAVVERGGMRVQQSYFQWLAEGAAQRAGDAERSFGDIYAEERGNVGPIGNVLDNAVGPIGDLWNAGSRVVQSRLADMFGGDQEQAAAYYQQQVGLLGEKIAATPMSPGAENVRGMIGALEPTGDIGQDFANFMGVVASDPAGFTAFLAETAAETAPTLAAAFGAGAATRNPSVFAGVLGGGSYLQERYLAPAELLAERGIDISTPEGALAAVTDPDLMREAAERGEIRGLIIGALDTISGGVAGETLARNPVLNMVLQSLVQAAFGGGGEAAAQVASGQQFSISDVLIEGLAEFVTAPIEVGGMAATSVREAMEKAPAAEAHAATLTEMSQRAAADPVRNRMPDAFRDYLRAAMVNTGAENLFVPADQFVQYFQGSGVDPFELADQLTGMSRADVEMAAETGGVVKIPTATWAADMAGGEHDQFIISNSTFAPDAMTAQEAAEFNARAQDALQEAWEEAEALRIEADELRQVYDIERETLVSSLRAAGRAPDVAQAEALPMVEFRRVMAERMGLTPEEFAARYPLPQVQGERPEGLDPKNVDELTRTLAEARNRRAVGLEKRGPSLLEFIGDYGGIIDPGGELRARDAATIRRPGKKTLKLERGGARAVGDMLGFNGGGKKYGFDDVALAAIEAGYLADDPVALEFQQAVAEGREVPDIGRALLDAIDRELRGEAEYAGAAVEVEDGLASVEEYLAGLGLSLDDADADIRAALEGQGREYGQPGVENMVVQHNLSAANLLHADKMRGLAVPSVAISNVDYPLDSFGEITLLGGSDLIDPRKDSASKVFDADVYSPRYPTVRYKVASKPFDKVWKRLGDVSAELGHVLSGEIDHSEVERKGLEAFRDSSAVQLQFLRDTGRPIDLPQQSAKTTYLTKAPEIAEFVGEYTTPYEVMQNPDAVAAIGRAIDMEVAIVLDARGEGFTADEVRGWYYDKDGDIRRNVIDAIQQEIRVSKRPGVDRSAARQALREAVQPVAAEFAAWVEGEFGSVLAGETIETQTASGNWKYLPHTLDNVVKVLRRKLRDGEGWNYGVASIRSNVANQFKSISAIKAARDKLIPSDAMQALKDESSDEFSALAGVMEGYAKHKIGFGFLDAFSEHLKEVAERGVRALDQYYDGLGDEQKQAVVAFLDKLANMPTEYFEAKIQRAVDISEFKAAVIPSDADKAVRDVLLYARVPVVEYDSSKPGARAAAIRQASGEHRLLFQSAVPTDPTQTPAFREWFGDSKVVDAEGKPLVVYHGTGHKFEAFDPNARAATEGGMVLADAGVRPFFFSNRQEVAADFAGGDADYVMPVYLSIKNPLVIEAGGLGWEQFDDQIVAAAKGGVYDGVILRNLNDSMFGDMENPVSDVFAAFEPTQIKSVNNRGTFDPADPRILYQSTPENPRWSGDGKDPTEWEGDTLSWKLNDNERRWLAGTDDADQFLVDGGELILGPDEIGQFSELVRENEAAQGRGSVPLRFRTYFQADAGFTGGGRGSIQFPSAGISNGETLVSLFQKADLSTFLHESGHYFLTVMQDAASLDPEGAIAKEFEAVKQWWRDNAEAVARDAGSNVTADDVRNAIDNGTSGDAAKDMAIDTGMQEQFARATEAYMLEGKAPSPSLRQAFEKFRAWLVSIYKTMRGLNVNVTDELRGVFDRMLATDAEIAEARQDIGADVALTAADLGMTDEQFQNFLRLRDQAKADASAKLLAETMAPIKRAQEQWFKDERKKVREDVERNTNAQPVYRAMEWMGNRRWLGDDAPEAMPDIRFSKDVLVNRYGAGVLDTLPRGKFTVYAVDGGLDPDDAAGWFGFPSGDAMVKAMERAPNRKELIEAETDKVMRERHGDVLRDGRAEQEAMEAVHTDSRGRELATELQALNAVAGLDRGLTAKDAREMARRTLSGMRTRDAVNAGRFLAAERKAAQEVARLTGTVTRDKMWMDRARRRVETQARGAVREQDGAQALSLPVDAANQNTARFNEDAAKLVEAKRRQLLNHALYSEALAISNEVEKAERLAARLAKAIQRRRSQKGKQTISNDSLDAIAEILERYDFRKMSGPAEQRRGALNRYLESMVDQGRENEVAIPRKVLMDAARTPYKTLLVDDLRGVVDTLKNLESTGRRWQALVIAGKEREINAAIDTITGSLKNNVGVKPAAWVDAGWQKAAGKGINQYLATFTTASTVIRHMDGREDLGPVYELLKADIDNAAYTEREMRETAANQIEALYSVYSEDEQREMAVSKAVPALGGQSFSKWHLISMALNMGNAGNLHRLTNKKARQHLTPQQVEVVKGLLDKRDWDFVQSVWDYLDTYRPMIEERQKRTTGVSPEWVEATAVETPHGTYRGGYYPIKYARDQGGASTPSLDGDNDIIQSMKLGSYAKAATKNGHLEARVANVQQSLLLDVGVIGQHTNEVIHDLAFSESIVNSWRLLNDQRVSDALLDAGMQEQHEALKLWLKDVAVGQVFASDVLSRTMRTLRSGFTVSRLAFNVGTALLQPTGLMQSAVVVGKKNLASAITQYMRDPVAATNEVIGRSRIMGERRKVFQKDLMDMVAETSVSAPTASRFRKFMDRYAVPASLSLMQYTQYYVVDVPTWMAAYSKGMTQFDGNQTRAAQYADMTLNRVQGSGLWSERSNIERGTLSSTLRQNAFVTLFTTLGSYFFAKMNLLMERTNALRAEPVTVGAAMGYAFDVALLLAGEAAVMKLTGMAIEAATGGGDDEGEDENLAMYLGAESLKVLAAGLPGIRDGVSVFQGFSGGTYASLLDLMARPAQQAAQGEFDAALVKSFVNLGGVVGRLPAAQANRVIDAFARQADGQDVAPMEFLLGRPR
jgi:hypothetical protein